MAIIPKVHCSGQSSASFSLHIKQDLKFLNPAAFGMAKTLVLAIWSAVGLNK